MLMIKKFLHAIWNGLNRLRKIVHALLMMVIVIFLVAILTSPSHVSINEKSVLLINPIGRLVDQLQGNAYERAVNEAFGEIAGEVLVDDIIDALDYAKFDDRIKIIFLNLNNLSGGGLSKLERIADKLEDVRESGKKIIAFADIYSQESYYIAAHADETYLHPDGIFFPEGYSFYTNFYKDLIDKLKVDWNIFRAGNYKSAVEPFIRNDMSPESKISRSRIAEKLWLKYDHDVSLARDLSPGTLNDFADSLLNNLEEYVSNIATVALSFDLFDDLLSIDQVEFQYSQEFGFDMSNLEDHKVSFQGYLDVMRAIDIPKILTKNIALIVASGEILDGNQAPGVIGGDSTRLLLREALHDESIQGVVIKIDTPGGSAFASEKILEQIVALKAANKPVVVLMGSVAASGGYWIAMAADKIYASPATITGSIGVFAMFPTFDKSLAELGIYTDGAGTNAWSGSFRVDREVPDNLKRLIQSQVDYNYNEFVSKVSHFRDIPTDNVKNIAEGQVWTGQEALENGLIDALGGIDDAIKEVEHLANLGGLDYGIINLEQKISPAELFAVSFLDSLISVGLDFSALGLNNGILNIISKKVNEFTFPFTKFNDPQGLYAYCFCEIN